MPEIAFRAPTPADDPAFERARGLAYGGRVDPHSPDPLVAGVRDHARSLIGLDGDEVVATSLGYGFEMSVPGEGRTVATAGLAGISVVPTHRRRGLLREVMRRNLDAAREQGEPVSVLWPSESAIYRRFGYGPATRYLAWETERVHAGIVADDIGGRTVRILPADPDKVAHTIAPIHDAARRTRPGMLDRSPGWWARRTAGAAERTVYVCVDGPDGPEGYAAYTVAPSWADDGPANILDVGEQVALTPEAEVALWRYLFGIDLVRTLRGWGLAVDSPLPHLVTDIRKLRIEVADGAWVRLVDVPAALTAREYAAPLDIVVEITDAFCSENAGRWQLTSDGGPGSIARCVRTDASADIGIDVADLATAYLGDTPLQTLAAGGLVTEHTPGAVAAADAAFRWSPAAWGVTWF